MPQETSEILRIEVLTLFPEVFHPLLETSIPGIAREKGLVSYHLHDIREHSTDSHRKVDDRPYGGGPGMVLQCGPVFRAWEAVREMHDHPPRLLLLSPQGKPFDQKMAHELAQTGAIALLCGHYEGFDERIRTGLPAEEVSIGDYVLSSGEVAAMVIVDAVVRLVPGVLGDHSSIEEESFAGDSLEYPQYTRPAEFRGMVVPDVLRSGDHGRIRRWRRQQAQKRTGRRRPDLLKQNDSENAHEQ